MAGWKDGYRNVPAEAGDRPPAPSAAAIAAFLAEYSRIAAASHMGCSHIDSQVTSALQAAYAVDFGAVRPPPRAALTVEQLAELLKEMGETVLADDYSLRGEWDKLAAWLRPRLAAPQEGQ
jgi:hypothetical protein